MNELCEYRMKRGWWCSRHWQHKGPCALRPKWWNLLGQWWISGRQYR